MISRQALVPVMSALFIMTACSEEPVIGSVDDYYTKYDAPRRANTATISGWAKFDDEVMRYGGGVGLCQRIGCAVGHIVFFDVTGLQSDCIETIDGREVSVSGRISRGELTEIISITDAESDEMLCRRT